MLVVVVVVDGPTESDVADEVATYARSHRRKIGTIVGAAVSLPLGSGENLGRVNVSAADVSVLAAYGHAVADA